MVHPADIADHPRAPGRHSTKHALITIAVQRDDTENEEEETTGSLPERILCDVCKERP